MKVLYITVPSYFDLEISYIRELSKIVEVRVLLCISPVTLKSSAFSLDSIHKDLGIFAASSYSGMQKYSSFIDLDIWYIANNPTNSLIDCYRLSRQINQFVEDYNPDIIHATDYGKQSSLTFLSLDSHYKRIFSLHDVVSHSAYRGIRKILKEFHRKTIIGLFPNILLFSHISDDILNKRLSSTHHVYHSILGAYDFLTKFDVTQNDYGDYILFFGRIDYYKGVDILIDSYLKSACREKHIKLVIAGKDNSNIIKKVDSDLIIVLNRYIENEELARLIHNSLFVVLPYRSATQSGVTKSAFALNKPVLCTDAGNLPNEVIDGKYGRVCIANNVDSLTRGINQMVSSNDDLLQYSANIAADWCGQGRYSWNRIACDMRKIYEEIIDKREM